MAWRQARRIRSVPRRLIGELLWDEALLRRQHGACSLDLQQIEDDAVRRCREALPEMPRATFAVIVATYKRAEQLDRALSSVQAQSFGDHVVMVVDDGGGQVSDRARAMQGVTVVSMPENTANLGLVRNVGVRLSDSPYIAFLDDDNTWEPTHLERAAESHRAGAALTYASVRRIDVDGRTLDILSEDFDRRRFRRRNVADASAITVMRSPWATFSRLPRKRGDPREDWELVWRLARRGPVVHLPEVSVNYLVNPCSYYTDWETGENAALRSSS